MRRADTEAHEVPNPNGDAMQRIRLDLEGIALNDEKGRLTATFRYRTADGVVVNLPESADYSLGWAHLEACTVDLRTGELVIRLKPEHVEEHRWLHGSRELRGQWLDRVRLEHPL
jgi:hypothetical protein